MHTVPEKLASLRSTLEASVQRQILELRVDVSRQIKELNESVQEAAFRRSQELFGPQVSLVESRLDEELGPLQRRVEEVFRLCSEGSSGQSMELISRCDGLQDLVLALQVELKPIREEVTTVRQSISELEAQPARQRAAVDEVRKEVSGVRSLLDEAVTNERNRASMIEEKLQKNIEASKEGLAERERRSSQLAEKQAGHALQHAATIEDRLMARLDDIRQEFLQATSTNATELAAQVDKQVDKAQKMNDSRLTEVWRALEANKQNQTADVNSALASVRQQAVTASEQSCELMIAELNTTLREGLERGKRELQDIREANQQSVEGARTELRQLIDSATERFQAEDHALRVLIQSAEKSAAAAAGEVERHALELSGRRLDDMLASLQKGAAEARELQRRQNEELVVALREEIKTISAGVDDRIEELSARCQQSLEAAGAGLGKRLQEDLAAGLKEANLLVEAVKGSTKDAVDREAEGRRSALVAAEGANSKHIHDLEVKVMAALEGRAAELKAHISGAAARAEQVATAQQEQKEVLRLQKLTQEEAVERGRTELQETKCTLEAQLQEAQKSSGESLRAAHDYLDAELTRQRLTAAQTHHSNREELDSLRTAIELRAPQASLNDTVAWAAARFDELKADIQGEYSRAGATEGDLSTRCNAAQEGVAECKQRLQQEMHALGSELTRVRAAATSLTHGLVKALQVLGFLPQELEVLPPKGADGCSPLVHRRWGLEVADLLDWEQSGQSLAGRVAQKAATSLEAAGVPSLLALVERKADEAELRSLRTVVRLSSTPNAGLQAMSPDSLTQNPCWSPTSAATGPMGHTDPRCFSALGGDEISLRSEQRRAGSSMSKHREMARAAEEVGSVANAASRGGAGEKVPALDPLGSTQTTTSSSRPATRGGHEGRHAGRVGCWGQGDELGGRFREETHRRIDEIAEMSPQGIGQPLAPLSARKWGAPPKSR
eukprot:gnl/TRDRNA2_/TRDRNA2_38236_c0_seq1.p1 gnl/TRDRNA2_/TRDRNA2_38236_c0~~gnl/TRDRNA2_/TRDRNA2_38236_c0_seq1.p1  ORF type:complete len:960 (-),score=237.73 gnl/TRDRNA2_/TRDRNA2_38236_c0_seq1:130-3009(-)